MNQSSLGTALPGTYRSDAKHGSMEIMQSDETQKTNGMLQLILVG